MSAFESTKKASSATELRTVSFTIGRSSWSSLVSPVARPMRRAYQPASAGTKRPRVDAEHGAGLGRADQDEDAAQDEPGDAHAEVDQREREPAPLALEDAGLAAHHRQRDRGHREQQRRDDAVETQQQPHGGGREEQQQPEPERRAVGDAQDDVLDLGDVVRASAEIRRAAVACSPSWSTATTISSAIRLGDRAVRLGAEDAARPPSGSRTSPRSSRPSRRRCRRCRAAARALRPVARLVSVTGVRLRPGAREWLDRHHQQAARRETVVRTPARSATALSLLPYLWSVVLAVLLLGPALGHGFVLSYDMVWVPDLALGRDALGARLRAAPGGALRRGGRGARRGGARAAAAEAGPAGLARGRRVGLPCAWWGTSRCRPGWRRSRWRSGTRSSPSGC